MSTRRLALLEGASFLLLLFVGMPLKHVWGIPMPTRILGMTHGVLTLFFVSSLVGAEWPARRKLACFAWSLIPFGAFWFERSILAAGVANNKLNTKLNKDR